MEAVRHRSGVLDRLDVASARMLPGAAVLPLSPSARGLQLGPLVKPVDPSQPAVIRLREGIDQSIVDPSARLPLLSKLIADREEPGTVPEVAAVVEGGSGPVSTSQLGSSLVL